MPLPPGSRFGPYEILAPLGSGGMGEVYRARDVRLDRNVAVKILPTDVSTDMDRRRRFEGEARALAALSHPNVLVVYDVGDENGVLFLVSELLEGETLRERLSRGRLPWRRAAEIAALVASGLAAAHGRGIVHRDLKPENLFLSADGQVKILDFGLARERPKEEGQPETSAPTLAARTRPGTVLGTVGYMSPEQVRGAAVDARSDIFSLGCVLYEMLAGTRPFRAGTAADTMAAILKENPPAIAESGATVPPELERIGAHCLEKDPDERFQSARDLAFDLGAVAAISGSGPAATPASALDSLMVLPFENAGGDETLEYLSDGITDGLIYSLSRIPTLKVMARSTVFRFKGQDVDPREVGQQLGVRAVLTGRVLVRGASLVVQAELVDVAKGWQLFGERYRRQLEDVLSVEEEIAQSISEKLKLQLTGEDKLRLARRQTEDPEAYQLLLKGRFHWNKRTEEGLRKGIEFFRLALERDPTYPLPYAGLADSYNILGFYAFESPRDAFPRAKAAAVRALELDGTMAEAQASLAYVLHYHEWRWAASEEAFQRALELGPNYAIAHQFYANHLVARGRFEEAYQSLARARNLDPLSLIINAAIGWMLHLGRRHEEAIAECRKVIDMDPSFVQSHLWLAQALEAKGRHDEAVEESRAAVACSDGSAVALAALGEALGLADRTDEARDMLDSLVSLAPRKYVSPFHRAVVWNALGVADETHHWLALAFEERSTDLVFLAVDPRWDRVREDARFVALCQKVGLG